MIKYDINGVIIPGERVGDFYIGMRLEDLITSGLITRDYPADNPTYPDDTVLEKYRNLIFMLNENNIVQEILILNNYKGKVSGIFGIGDKLFDFRNKIKFYVEEAEADGCAYFPEMCGLRTFSDIELPVNFDGIYPVTMISIFDKKLGSLR